MKKDLARAILRENSLSLAFAAWSPHEGADDTGACARSVGMPPSLSDLQRIMRSREWQGSRSQRSGGIPRPTEAAGGQSPFEVMIVEGGIALCDGVATAGTRRARCRRVPEERTVVGRVSSSTVHD